MKQENSYYKLHVCDTCGKNYKAFSAGSTTCPKCRQPHVCLFCGKEYRARHEESYYCPDHRYLQSRAYLEKFKLRRSEYFEKCRRASEETKERKRAEMDINAENRIKNRENRIKNGENRIKPKRVVTEAVILEHKPVEVVKEIKPVQKSEEKFFLTVGKIRYGFATMERLEQFKKKTRL